MGRICDGYGIWGGGGALGREAETPSQSVCSHPVRTTMDSLRPKPTSNPGLRVSPEEQSYLEWLIHGTAARPPRIFNSAFWDPAILQAAIQEPMILNALLALSAAHKRFVLDPANLARHGLVPDALEVFLLKHNGHAIKGLQVLLGGREKVPGSKKFAAITMCALLFLIELMRGHFEIGRIHLSNGAHIVRDYTNEPGQADMSHVLVQFFPRIQDQMMLFQRQSPARRPISTPLPASPVPRLRFASPVEGGRYLDDLVEQVAYLAEQKRLMPCPATASRAMHNEVCRYLLACFQSWSLACNATMTEQHSTLTPGDIAAYEALRQWCRTVQDVAERNIGFDYNTIDRTETELATKVTMGGESNHLGSSLLRL